VKSSLKDPWTICSDQWSICYQN